MVDSAIVWRNHVNNIYGVVVYNSDKYDNVDAFRMLSDDFNELYSMGDTISSTYIDENSETDIMNYVNSILKSYNYKQCDYTNYDCIVIRYKDVLDINNTIDTNCDYDITLYPNQCDVEICSGKFMIFKDFYDKFEKDKIIKIGILGDTDITVDEFRMVEENETDIFCELLKHCGRINTNV